MKIDELGGRYISEQIIGRSKDMNIIYLTDDVILNSNCVRQLGEYIEELINRNKELEKFIYSNSIVMENEKRELVGVLITPENFIPKSKVKEKIEELKESITVAQGEELLIFDSKIDVLQELLEK